MSPDRLGPAETQKLLARTLGPLTDGGRLPGGCDHCDAYQTATRHSARVWRLDIHHDEGCPFLAEYEKKRGRR